MALDSFVGTFTLNTSTGSQSVTGVGFQPKIVFFICNLTTADGIVADAVMSFGAGISSTERFCHHWNDEDGVTTQDCTRMLSSSHIIFMYTAGSGTTEIAQVDLTSLDADGFTIDNEIANSAAYRVAYMALGGSDLTDVGILQFNPSGLTGNDAITGMGFGPDSLIVVGSGTNVDVSSADSIFSIGVAESSSSYGCIEIVGDNGEATSVNRSWMTQNSFSHHGLKAGGIESEGTLASLDADGFTLNWSDAAYSNDEYYAIGLEGVSCKVGIVDTQTSTGTWSETGLTITPAAGFFFSQMEGTQAEQVSNGSTMIIGMVGADNTEQVVMGTQAEGGQGTMDTDTFSDDALIYQAYNFAQGLDGSVAFSSWNSGGFTLNQVDADPHTHEIMYMVFDGGVTVTEYNQAAAGSFTPTGALTKETSIDQAGSIAPAGTIVRETAKYPSGAVGTSGAIVRYTTKLLAGILSYTGALAVSRLYARAVAGVISFAGDLSSVNIWLQIVAGTFSAGGVLARDVAKNITGTLGLTGNAVKLSWMTVAGVLSMTGALTRQTTKVVAGAWSASGAVTRQTTKIVAGVLGLAGAIAQAVTKLIDVILSDAATYTVTLSDAATYTVTVTDAATNTVTLVDSGAYTATLTDAATNTVTLTDTVWR